MRRAAGVAILLALALAAPAWGQAANDAPTAVTFDGLAGGGPYTVSGASVSTYCPGSPQVRDGRDGGPYLRLTSAMCPSANVIGAEIAFDAPQRIVELFVRAGSAVDITSCATPEGCDTAPDLELPAGQTGWVPAVVTAPGATIRHVSITATGSTLDLDDLSFSPVDQPDTAVALTSSSGSSATFALTTKSPFGGTFGCALDNVVTACANPFTATGLAAGTHSLQAQAVDVYGRADRTPATLAFFIPIKGPPPPIPDRDGDGVPDSNDNCPDAANSDQADRDGDGVGNVCEVLPPGDVPPVAGVNSVVKLVSGEVFVKLPTRTALGFRGLRALFQTSGFVPLKGVASVPLGSTVDTRKGEIAIETAANGAAPTSRSARTQSARLKAALFTMRQARRKRAAKATAPIPTDIALLSPPGAESACQKPAAKGVVRTVSMVAKGFFRALAGASTATARSATFNTTDRCDGTFTEVGKGKVTLTLKGVKAPVTVRAGQAYLVKAKLFRARKGSR